MQTNEEYLKELVNDHEKLKEWINSKFDVFKDICDTDRCPYEETCNEYGCDLTEDEAVEIWLSMPNKN